jgi:hypothetical protein
MKRSSAKNNMKRKSKKKKDAIRDWLYQYEDAPNIKTILLMDEYEKAFLGVDFKDEHPRAVYSINKIVAILAKEMSEEDAWEYFNFNIAGAFVGPQTPIYIATP